MDANRSIYTLSLMFIIAATFSYADYLDVYRTIFNDHIPYHVRPHFYDIRLTLSMNKSGPIVFTGESSIEFEVIKNSVSVCFSFVGNVTFSMVMSEALNTYTPKILYDIKKKFTVLLFENPLQPGMHTLHINYVSFPIDQESILKLPYMSELLQRKSLVMTNFNPIGAYQLFPCWDEASSKAVFHIVVQHPHNYMSFSIKPVQKEEKVTNEISRTHFGTSPEVPLYRVAIMLLPRNDFVYNSESRSIKVWCRKQFQQRATFSQYVATEIFEGIKRYLQDYEDMQMDHIAIPYTPDESMDNWRLPVYKENLIMYYEESDPIVQKTEIIRVITYSTMNQWFSNPSWSNLWLSKGFAGFFQTVSSIKVLQEWRMQDLFVVQIQQASLHFDVDCNMKPLIIPQNQIPKNIPFFSLPLRFKAPAMFRMLRYIASDNRLRKGMIIYLDKYKYKTAEPDRLWEIMQNVLDEKNMTQNEYTVKTVMDTWTKQQNYPVVYVKRKYDTGEVMIWQENIHNCYGQTKKWWIPISYTTQANPNFCNPVVQDWLSPEIQYVKLDSIDSNHWIIVNLKQIGYYRVNYDAKNWQLITNYLKSENYMNIHAINRAQIIDDAFYLMTIHELDVHVFLNLMDYLSQETDYIVWYPMFKIFERLSGFLPFKESDALKNRILNILNGLLEKIGYTQYSHEHGLADCLKQEAAKWACLLDSYHCKKAANVKLDEHLRDPLKNKLPAGWKEWTFCNGLLTADLYTWKKVLSLYIKPTFFPKKFWNTIVCGKDIVLFKLAFNMQMVQPIKTRYNRRVNLLQFLVAKNATEDVADTLRVFEQNLYNFPADTQYILRILTIIINRSYAEEHFDKIIKFVQKIEEKKKQHVFSETVQNIIRIRRHNIQQQLIKFWRMFKVFR